MKAAVGYIILFACLSFMAVITTKPGEAHVVAITGGGAIIISLTLLEVIDLLEGILNELKRR